MCLFASTIAVVFLVDSVQVRRRSSCCLLCSARADVDVWYGWGHLGLGESGRTGDGRVVALRVRVRIPISIFEPTSTSFELELVLVADI